MGFAITRRDGCQLGHLQKENGQINGKYRCAWLLVYEAYTVHISSSTVQLFAGEHEWDGDGAVALIPCF